MGRKGVSKRKPKQSGTNSSANINGSAIVRSGERSPVQSAIKDKSAPSNRDGMNQSTGSNKQNKH